MTAYVVRSDTLKVVGTFNGSIKHRNAGRPGDPPAVGSFPRFDVAAPWGGSITISNSGSALCYGPRIRVYDGMGGMGEVDAGTVHTTPNPDLVTYSLNGAFELRAGCELVEEFVSDDSTNAAGFPAYSGSARPDFPMGSHDKVKLYWRVAAGAAIYGSASVGTITVVASNTFGTAPAPIGTNVTADVIHSVTALDETSGVSWTFAGTTTTFTMPACSDTRYSAGGGAWGSAQYDHSAQSISVSLWAAAGTTTATVNTTQDIDPIKGYELAIRSQREPEAYTDSLTAIVERYAGADGTVVFTTDATDSTDQSRWSVNGFLNGTAQTGVSIDQWRDLRVYLTGASMGSAGEDTGDTRVLMHGRAFDAITLAQAGTVALDGSFAVAGTTARTFSPRQNWSSYRYLDVATDAPATPYSMTIGAKVWQGTADGAGLWHIDLAAPSNLNVNVDTRDSVWPIDTCDADIDNVTGDGSMWGLHTVGTVTFTGTANVAASGMRLVRAATGDAWVRQPSDLWVQAYAPSGSNYTYYRRLMHGLTDGRLGFEVIAGYKQVGATGTTYTERSLADIVADVNGTATTWGTAHPGWSAAYAGGIDVADGADGAPVLNGLLNRQRPACWLHGNGLIYAGSAWNSAGQHCESGHTWQAQELFEQLSWVPGCGDVFGHASGTAGGPIIVKAGKLLRGEAQGGLIGLDGLPVSGGVVTLERTSDAANAGAGTAGTDGSYVTLSPYARGPVSHVARYGALSLTGPIYTAHTRRLWWRGAYGVASWISRDVGPDSRHHRAYVYGGNVVYECADAWSAWAGYPVAAGSVPCVRADTSGRTGAVLLSYAAGGTVYETRTIDGGRTWTVAEALGAGSYNSTLCARDGRTYTAWWAAGSVIVAVCRDAWGGTLFAPGTIATGVDQDGIALNEYSTGGGAWGLKLTYRAAGTIIEKASSDGRTFA